MLAKSVPFRCKKYRDFVKSLPCVISGMDEVIYHHMKGHGQGGSTKASDLFTFPLIDLYHTGDKGIHRLGYPDWEEEYGNQWLFVIDTINKAIESNIVTREFVIEEIKAQVINSEDLSMLLGEFE